jgi:predicted DNA-binding protein (MmcQ/YjbR family)
MNIQQLYDYCLSKKGVTEHFPFDEDTLVFKVGNKMFALTSLSNWEKEIPSLNLKCDPKVAVDLREKFEGINPGYHMSKVHWNTININEDVPDKKIIHLINHSYELVFSSLTKKIKTEIENI